PPATAPLLPYTTLFRSKTTTTAASSSALRLRGRVRIRARAIDRSHGLSGSVGDGYRHVLTLGEWFLEVKVDEGPARRVCSVERRSEEHTSELQSQSNIV